MPDRTSPDWPSQLERGIAERALPGEARSGDQAVFVTRSDGALVAAIDGLGHGGEAADAAGIAADVIAQHPDEDPAALLDRCHVELRHSRGVVMTVAWFDLAGARLRWTGVGNVEGRLIRAGGGPSEGAFTRGGVVGYNLPDTRVTSAALADGDVVVLDHRRRRPRFRGGDRARRDGPADGRPDPRHARAGGRRRAGRGGAVPLYTGRTMKTDIHPEYVEAHVRCTCGNEFTTRSTTPEIRVEICSNCHPFYTGKQKLVDTGGRVERFKRRAAKRAR